MPLGFSDTTVRLALLLEKTKGHFRKRNAFFSSKTDDQQASSIFVLTAAAPVLNIGQRQACYALSAFSVAIIVAVFVYAGRIPLGFIGKICHHTYQFVIGKNDTRIHYFA